MAQKTALQQLKDFAGTELKLLGYEHQDIQNKIEELLPVEKEQMEKAWTESESSEWCDDGFEGFYESEFGKD
jgi:hypothetical protein